MHGGSKSATMVSWAVRDATEMLVIGECSLLLDLSSGDRESLENFPDVGSSLHGDDSELILFVDPDEECLPTKAVPRARMMSSLSGCGIKPSLAFPMVQKTNERALSYLPL